MESFARFIRNPWARGAVGIGYGWVLGLAGLRLIGETFPAGIPLAAGAACLGYLWALALVTDAVRAGTSEPGVLDDGLMVDMAWTFVGLSLALIPRLVALMGLL